MTAPPAHDPREPVRRDSANDVADALLGLLVFRRAAALTLAPRGGEYEVALTQEATPKPLTGLPLPLGHATAARFALIGGLDPWGAGDRLGRIVVRVGRASAEFMVVLRDTHEGFAAELRRLVEFAEAGSTTAELERGAGQIGPYRIEGELGRGAMGIVYRARREGAGGAVALKVLNPAVASDPAMAARFVREGRAAALVNDPGVVGVSDFGMLPNGRAFLVMELVNGRTLEELLAESGALPAVEAVRIGRRIASALAVAHVRGVIHRDLKPSNVFLAEEGRIKIADFGAALVEDPLRSVSIEDSIVLGTPAYMAPEQAQALPTDERADIYSLGCMLFRMLEGRPPFQGGALIEVLRRHIDEPAPLVSSPHGPLPELLVGCVAKALAKKPDDRYRSVSELQSVLGQVERVLGGRPDRWPPR